jgi:ferredoxin-like protein FixX
MPKLYTDGALIVGDSASFCNAQNLAGIHMAMKSGMLAADTLVEALAAQEFTAKTLGGYTERFRRSWAFEEHHQARNFGPSVERGIAFFALNEPIRMLTGGRGISDELDSQPGHRHMKKLAQLPPAKREKEPFEFDGKITFSKEHLVGFSGTQHEADQPSHLVVADTDLCSDVCTEEYGNPCENFCPAAVYEMVPDKERPGRKTLFIHHENCVHCKTCDIADPYQVITWTPPEGGEGPDYTQMLQRAGRSSEAWGNPRIPPMTPPLVRGIACAALVAILQAPGTPSLAGALPSVEVATSSFERFTAERIGKMRARADRARERPTLQPGPRKPVATYRASAEPFETELRRTGSPASPYVGVLRYTQHVYSCEDLSATRCRVASSIPITEVFRYRDGKWVH